MFIKSKKVDHAALDALISSGLNPHLARFYSARGIKHIDDATVSIEKIIPPTINTKTIEPEFEGAFNFTLGKSVKKDVRVAMSNTFGFGGNIATSVYKRYEE